MVRGPAALLAAAAAAFVYFALAPVLPEIPGEDAAALVSGVAAGLALAAVALALVPGADAPAAVGFVALGCGLFAGALTAGDLDLWANVPKAVFAAGFGILFARWLEDAGAGAVVLAVPLFVAAFDVWSVASGPAASLVERQPEEIDLVSFVLPRWGSDEGGQLGISDLVFLGFFATAAWRFGFRRGITLAALAIAVPLAVAASVVWDTALPVLPFMAAALLLPNADRLPAALRG